LLVPSVKKGAPYQTGDSRWLRPYWSDRPIRKVGEGDCDRDSDCGPGLKCGHNSTRLPGVRNTGVMGGGRDFCYDPKSNDAVANNSLRIVKGSPFDTIIGTSNSLAGANNNGLFYKKGNDKYLTKEAFMHENFPYWHFLRTAEKN